MTTATVDLGGGLSLQEPPTHLHPNGRRKQYISLTSPVSKQIAGFILGNALCRQCGGMPLRRQETSPTKLPVCQCEGGPLQFALCQQDSVKDRDVIICGSGPSLGGARNLLNVHPDADVWGCNDALMWLTRRRLRVTHGVGIDQSPDLYTTCWTEPPAVQYLLASSVSHQLIAHLVRAGHAGRIALFHSFVGFEGEQELYQLLYQPAPMIGSGLNVVNRSIPLALWMGYRTAYVIGADCALGRKDVMHVGERQPETGVILRGTINGRRWATKPDMLVSAIDLVHQKRDFGERVQLIGDTLPNALADKDDAFLARCVSWGAPPEVAEHQPEPAKGAMG